MVDIKKRGEKLKVSTGRHVPESTYRYLAHYPFFPRNSNNWIIGYLLGSDGKHLFIGTYILNQHNIEICDIIKVNNITDMYIGT